MAPEDIKLSAETSRMLRQAMLESSKPVAELGERIEAAAIKVKDIICFVERPGRRATMCSMQWLGLDLMTGLDLSSKDS